MSWLSRAFDRAVAAAIAGSVAGMPARLDADPPPQSHPAPQIVGGGGWQNAMTGMGGARDPATMTTYGYQMPLPDTVRDNLYEHEAMTGIVIDRPGDDLVRRGISFKGFEGFDTTRIKSKQDDLEMNPAISRAYKWARKDGGSAIFMIVNDGRPNVAPIDYQRLTHVHALHVLTRREVSVAQWNWDPTTRGFGKPLFYYLHTPGTRSANNLIHADRVVRFVNRDLPHQAMMRHNGWGISEIDRIWQPLRAKGSAVGALSTILTSFAVDVVKIKGLSDALKLGQKKELQDRAELMRYTLGNLSKIFVDADGEDFMPVVRSASGLAEIVEILIDEFQAATWIPKSILRGLSPGGLGDGENAGEVRAYYDFIAGQQGVHYIPPATRITDLILRSRFGPTMGEAPEHWYLEPNPLWTPTDRENAAIRASNAAARASDISTGVISVAEARTDPTLHACYDIDDEDDSFADDAEEGLFPDGETPISTGKAAQMFGVRPQSIVTMIQKGTIGHYKLNGRYVVSQQEILRAVKGRAAGDPAALTGPAEPGAGDPDDQEAAGAGAPA
jgi:phage-related protein (TIGR01555 family)